MADCVSIAVEGGRISCGGPSGVTHREHEHEETQLTVHVPSGILSPEHARAWVVPGGMPHRGGWDDGTVSLVFHFRPAIFKEALDGAEGLPTAGEVRDSLIQHLAVTAATEIRSGRQDPLFLSSVYHVLAGQLVRLDWNVSSSSGLVRCIRDLIESRMDRPLTVAEMARDFGMGPQKLTRLIKQSTGCSPHQYVTKLRVERAKESLRKTRIHLAELAFGLGFASQSHFTAVFRRHVGVTPKVYREATNPTSLR